MKGLLIKDFCLLRNQKRILPIYLLLAVWFTAFHNDGFAFPFLMMMASILTGSTISYDEIDHSQAYLFVLPVDRKTYVQEKFVLGGILAAASLLLAILCSIARMLVDPGSTGTELGSMIVLSMCIGAVFIAVMIPIRIRFGGDQGRIVLYTAFALIALVVVLISRVFPASRNQMTEALSQMGMTTILSAAAAGSCVLLITGYVLGIHWVEKKEF